MRSAKGFAWVSLTIALVGAVVSRLLPSSFGSGLLRAACDAALAGGLADLYAVTALFRHPLGLRIPHTAILPQSRAQLAEAAKGLVTEDWLSKDAIHDKLATIDMAHAGIELVRRYESELSHVVPSLVLGGLRRLDGQMLATWLAAPIRSWVDDIDPKELIARLGRWGVSQGYHERILDALLDEFTPVLSRESAQEVAEQMLRSFVDELRTSPKIAKFSLFLTPLLGMIDYASISRQFLGILSEQVGEIRRDPYHPNRLRLLELMARLPERADTWAQPLTQLIRAWAHSDDFVEAIARALSLLQSSLEKDITPETSDRLAIWVRDWISDQLQRLEQDESKRSAIDHWLREQTVRFIDRYHGVLGTLVEESLAKLSDEVLVATIEQKVGHHLQWIRVNGAIVGGLVGIALYLMTRMSH